MAWAVGGLFLLFCSVPAPAGWAAEAAGNAQGVTPAAAETLLKTLENEEERERFLERLRTLATVAKEGEAKPEENFGARTEALLIGRVRAVSVELQDTIAVLADAPKAWTWLLAQATDEAARQYWLDVLLWLGLVLTAGFAGEWIARALLRPARRTVEDQAAENPFLRAGLLAARTLLDLLPIAAFAAFAYGTLSLTTAAGDERLAVIFLINANLLARAILAAARMLLMPHAGSLRLLPIGNATARYGYIWARRFTHVAVYGFFILEAALRLGLSRGASLGFIKAVGLVLAALAIVFVLQNRKGVGDWLRTTGGTFKKKPFPLRGLRNRFAAVWHILAILYIVVLFGIWALGIEEGFAFVLRASLLSLSVLIAAWVLLAGLHRLIDRVFEISDALKHDMPGLEERANRYLVVLHYTVRYLVLLAAALWLLEAWGIDAFGWLTTDFGRRVFGTLLTIGLVVFLAAFLAELATAFIERQLKKSERKDGAVKARAMTLLPLFRMAVLVLITVVATMIVLSELGLDIAPLIAGAGVVGLAIGFGAQTLVKDIITGLFILMEDQIAVGDVVRIGTHAGLVEGLTIRTIRLRDLEGKVHMIPFSSVDTVLNMTKDFSYAVFEIGIAYREDVDAVIPVLEEIGAEMQADAAFADRILEPIEVLGLDRFDDSAVIIKARIKTRPMQQWATNREFNRRMKQRFDALGIEIPFPHRTVYQGEANRVFQGLGRSPKAPPTNRATRTGGGRGGTADEVGDSY